MTEIMIEDTPHSKPSSRGRPRKSAIPTERQRAYRQRLRERGLCVQTRIVRVSVSDDAPLTSAIIDLSACQRR